MSASAVLDGDIVVGGSMSVSAGGDARLESGGTLGVMSDSMTIENLNDVSVSSGSVSLESLSSLRSFGATEVDLSSGGSMSLNAGGSLSGVAVSDAEMRVGGEMLLRGE